MAKVSMAPTADELLAVIRSKCLDCCAGMKGAINNCTVNTCPCWPYRSNRSMGKAATPKRCKGQISIVQYLKQMT